MNTTLRKTIKTIDRHLFSGIFRKLNLKYKRHTYTNKMHSIFQYNNIVCITSKQQNYLGELFDRYGSDKGYGLLDKTRESPALHYNDIYELMFFQHKYQTKLILECGIGGKSKNTFPNMAHHEYSIPRGSLRAWRSYFPNAQIVLGLILILTLYLLKIELIPMCAIKLKQKVLKNLFVKQIYNLIQ